MIGNAVEFCRAVPRVTWLVVGKGPTSARLDPAACPGYAVLTLNHACKLVRPDLALFVDLEAYCGCRHAGLLEGVPVALPWHPHICCRATARDLGSYLSWGDFGAAFPPTAEVYSFNSTTAGRLSSNPALPTVRVRFFSAVAAFNLLALAGAREIATLGVDGGTDYNPVFAAADRLRNGRKTFDDQFPELRETCRKNNIRWTCL